MQHSITTPTARANPIPSAYDWTYCEIDSIEREIVQREEIGEAGTVRFLQNESRRLRNRLAVGSGTVRH